MESSDDDNDSGYSNSSSNLVSGSIPPSPDLGKTELAKSLINSSERNPALLKARVLWDHQDKFGTHFKVDKNEIVTILYRENDQVCVMNAKGRRGFLPFSYCTLFRKSKVVRSTSCGDYSIYGNQTAKVIYKGSVGKLQKSASEPNVNTTKLTSLPGNKLDGKVTNQEISHVRPCGLLERSNDISNSLDECFIQDINGHGKPAQDGFDQGVRRAPETYYRRLKVSVMHFRRDSEEPVSVLFDFDAIDENDVSVERGETVYVLNKDDADWWWIEKENGDEGFVPRSYVSAEFTKRLQDSKIRFGSASSTTSSESSSNQVRFQDPLCIIHNYEQEDTEFEQEAECIDCSYNQSELKTDDDDSSIDSDWSMWC